MEITINGTSATAERHLSALNTTTSSYYYVTNLQGDIIAILDSTGNCVAEYSYDAWGNCTVEKDTDTIAYINPLRYRGYYYDSDTNLYYLQSRYYDPHIGRFVSSDDASMTLNEVYNLFAYCDNVPITYADKDGQRKKKIKKATVIRANYLGNKKLLKGIGLKRITRKKAIYTTKQCLNILRYYHSYINAVAQKFHMPSAMIRAILYRELTCYGYDDLLADGMVVEYYTGGPFANLHKKKDSSTGLAQIFASTAIEAEKKLGYNNTRNIWTMWQYLNDDYNSIFYCGMVLRMEAMNLGMHKYEEIFYKNYSFISKVFARYNGGSKNYGKTVLKIYKQFLKG